MRQGRHHSPPRTGLRFRSAPRLCQRRAALPMNSLRRLRRCHPLWNQRTSPRSHLRPSCATSPRRCPVRRHLQRCTCRSAPALGPGGPAGSARGSSAATIPTSVGASKSSASASDAQQATRRRHPTRECGPCHVGGKCYHRRASDDRTGARGLGRRSCSVTVRAWADGLAPSRASRRLVSAEA
jgi:hypothetical protein